MFMQLTTFLCAIQILAEVCKAVKLIDLPSDSDDPDYNEHHLENTTMTTVIDETEKKIERRFMAEQANRQLHTLVSNNKPDELDVQATDKYLKQKISSLIGQTIHDIASKVKSVQEIKERSRDEAAYKAGFLTSMVRKCRVMLDDLFNLAVKHKDNWKALQQLKIFEYIVHVNVDTTNLVRQLVEIHIQHLNSTSSNTDKKRVVLL